MYCDSYHNKVVHGVEVGVAVVNADGVDGEPESLGAPADDDGGLEARDQRR